MFPQLVDAVIFWVLFGRITMYNFFTHQKLRQILMFLKLS